MTLQEFVGNWIYWPLVIGFAAGVVSWTLNCISVSYTEVDKQIRELRRVNNQPPPSESADFVDSL